MCDIAPRRSGDQLRIAINLRLLNPGKIGGMEVYVRNLIKYLLRIDKENEYLLLVTTQNSDTLVYDQSRVSKALISHQDFEREIPGILRSWNADMYFCPLLILEPLYVDIPSVINIPDVQHEFFPGFFSSEVLEWRRKNYRVSAQTAAAVLTLSEFSKETIVEKTGVASDKVFSIHLAAGEEYHANLDENTKADVRRKYGLPVVYGYYPANTWAHKNHVNLLKALDSYRQRYGDCPDIVLTGAESEGHKDFAALVKGLGLKDKVRYIGYVEKNEMPYLYANAAFLVFPSLFEGFGMPVLEAMLCGCPVTCSNTTSLPEVAGSAALYFDPQNPDDIAEKMRTIMTDEAMRARFIEEGRELSLQFSWESVAKKTFDIFRNVVDKRHIQASVEKPVDLSVNAVDKNTAHTRVEKPLVTIITPSFNQGRFIEETILSVLNQDYPNIEYIVIDGGSTDNSIDIIKKYEGRLRWISERDNGQADGINKGFRMAKGEIVAWLNSDDTYFEGTVTKVMEFFSSNPDTMMVYGEGYEIDEDSKRLHRFPATQAFNLSKLIHVWDYILQPTVFMKKAALDDVGLLDKNLKWCLDWDLWMRIGTKHKVAYLDVFLANSRIYKETKTSTGGFKRFMEIIRVIRRYSFKTWPPGYFIYSYDLIHNTLNGRVPYLYNLFLKHIISFVANVAVKSYNRFFRTTEYN